MCIKIVLNCALMSLFFLLFPINKRLLHEVKYSGKKNLINLYKLQRTKIFYSQRRA